METIDCVDFEDFEKKIQEVRTANTQSATKLSSKVLFRGHANAEWQLGSTLERYDGKEHFLRLYLYAAENIRFKVEGFTDRNWPSLLNGNGAINLEEPNRSKLSIPSLGYLIYLRHHSFPSPFIDWTESPYIAALFAFSECKPDDGRIAIFSFQEYTGMAKLIGSNGPFIQSIGPYMNSHKRHILQQARYTIALERTGSDYRIYPMSQISNGVDQDVIIKYTIPCTEKYKVIRKLEDFNLSLFSLYGSEDALMQTLAIRAFHTFKH